MVGVVNREVRRIRARDVHAQLLLEGHEVTYESVGNSLYYAANTANKILKTGRGEYAPLSYTDEAVAEESKILTQEAV